MLNLKFSLFLTLLVAGEIATAAEGFEETNCRAIKGAVELFLALADENFKEAERLRQSGDETGADATFGEASAMTELAENYSVVYATFCKP